MEIKRCIICYATTTSARNANINKFSNFGKDTALNRQLTVIFLLRKFFKTPQDICRQLLEEYGSPSEWIDWCNSCSFLLKRAKCVYDQITLLRKQFDALHEELKTSIQFSKSNQQVPEEIEKNSSGWGATEIIRDCLTKSYNYEDDTNLENSQSEVEFKVENEEVLDNEDECSLFFQEDSTFEEDKTDPPLDLEAKILFPESKPCNRRFSSRLRKKSVKRKDSDSFRQSFTLAGQENVSDGEDPEETGNVSDLKGNRNFKCEKCLRKYTTFYSLKEHFINAHGELPFSCQKCNKKLLNENELKKHNERFHKRTHTVSCPKCPTKTFLHEKTLRQHCRNEHNDEYLEIFPPKRTRRYFATYENSLDCKKCGKIFVHLGSLRLHCRKYHAELYSEMFKNIRSDTCDKCDVKFTSRVRLKEHYQKEHPKDFKLRYYEQRKKRFLSCSYCPYKTFKADYLQMHLKKHKKSLPTINLDQPEKNIDLSVTSKVENVYIKTENIGNDSTNNFSSLEPDANLPFTLDNNSGSNPSIDEDFDDPDFSEEDIISSEDNYNPGKRRKFRRQCKGKKLWKPNETNHDNNSRKVPCPICPAKSFANEKCLRAHCRKEHPEEFKEIFPPKRATARSATLENSVPCKKCGNLFVCEKTMKAHCKNYHPEYYEKMFSKEDKTFCDKCNKKFRNRQETKLHYQKEHLEYYHIKYYEGNIPRCPHCPFKTTNKTYLAIHISNHNNLNSSAEKDLFTNQESTDSASLPGSSPKTALTEYERLRSIPNEGSLSNLNTTMSHNLIDKRLKCESCPNSYTDVYSLKEHYLNVHGELPLSCDKCSAKLVNEYHMTIHKEKYHNEAKKISCPICVTKIFSSLKSLRAHCRTFHLEECDKIVPCTKANPSILTEEETVACEICESKFVCLKTLKSHCKNYHPDSQLKIFETTDDKTCTECNESFPTRQNLKSHYEKDHPRVFKLKYYSDKFKKVYPCPHCPFKTTKNYLEDHINTHLNLRPYVCDFCGETFKNIKVLRNHQQSKHYEQLGLEPFKCEYCGKMFETPSYLKTHVRNQHLGQHKYFCPVCNRGFDFQSYLKLHLQSHNGEKTELCEECGKSFQTAAILKMHIRAVHRNERPFPCKKCNKKFACSGRLKRHEQGVHSDGTKPYECKVCHKRFPVRNYLYIHMRSHKRKGEVPPEQEKIEKTL